MATTGCSEKYSVMDVIICLGQGLEKGVSMDCMLAFSETINMGILPVDHGLVRT